jgi:quercetin dioxygenase-like cupin family protein
MAGQMPIIRQHGEGERFWFAGGGVFTMKATSEETAGAFVLLEDNVVQGKVTPMHRHPDFDETIYVLDGDLLVDMDGTQFPVGAGGIFVAPRTVAHAFKVTSSRARLLCLQTPGSGEDFYRRASQPISSDTDAERPADLELLSRAAAESPSIELLGPPPFDTP